jgi:hypothetical protein
VFLSAGGRGGQGALAEGPVEVRAPEAVTA